MCSFRGVGLQLLILLVLGWAGLGHADVRCARRVVRFSTNYCTRAAPPFYHAVGPVLWPFLRVVLNATVILTFSCERRWGLIVVRDFHRPLLYVEHWELEGR